MKCDICGKDVQPHVSAIRTVAQDGLAAIVSVELEGTCMHPNKDGVNVIHYFRKNSPKAIQFEE